MPNDDLRVAIYARVSGEQQAKDDTIASQLEAVTQRVASDALECAPNCASWTTATAGTYSPARASNDSGTKPPPVSSIASTSSIQISFHANMHIKC